MGEEKETREKLLESARREFAEKGYMKASLRNICKEAGVTTGALYFFFKDKDELFQSIVTEPLEQIKKIMKKHYEIENDVIENDELSDNDLKSDKEAAYEVIHLLYEYRDDMLLMLTKAQGSSLENIVDYFVNVSEEHYHMISNEVTQKLQLENVGKSVTHWFAHMQIDLFVFIITHIETEEEARNHMKFALDYMIYGWYGMLGLTPDRKII